jgi:S-adenosylmethionine:tRNA ribosyltransferase-isomerase
MKLSLFNYNLPTKLIAQKPSSPRDHSRLLVFNKKTSKINHEQFFNLPKYLNKNDVLVFNNTKVFPARIIGQKLTGGEVEVLLLKKLTADKWEAMLRAKKAKSGLKLRFKHSLSGELVERLSAKTWEIKFNLSNNEFYAVLDEIGQSPIPHYINVKNPHSKLLKKQYQTIYAKYLGSAAAPTAGLHFTKNLLNKIKKIGCKIEFVTLHVGLGTFEPVNTENIEDYKIHNEWASIDKATRTRLIKAKENGQRIISVGTTSIRTLEYFFSGKEQQSSEANINIFIYPGYKFKFVDAMITNFHLPKSTLLMLVSAFIGRKKTLELYQKAIGLKYRFFSFGDAMFIY